MEIEEAGGVGEGENRERIDRRRAPEDLRRSGDELEARAEEYQVDLLRTNEALTAEIADHARAEEALRESEERFRCLVENAGDAFSLHDIEGKIVQVNQRACESLGYERDELLSLGVADIEQRFSVSGLEELSELMVTGTPVTRDGVHVRKDCSTFPVEVRLKMFDSRDGRLFLALARDVTERKRLEGQLRQSQKMEALGRLAGGIAHDFNNVLTAIIGYAYLTAVKPASIAESVAMSREILDTAERAAHLTRQLLAFSHRQVAALSTINLNGLILDIGEMLSRLIGEDIELLTQPAPDLGLVKADAGQIEQVLVNLAVNSRDSMPNGGRLTIRSSNVTIEQGDAPLHPGVTHPARMSCLLSAIPGRA